MTLKHSDGLLRIFFALPLFGLASLSHAQAAQYGGELEGFDYPHPVQRFSFDSQRQDMQMAYLDVMPESHNGHTIVLLHGKNFCAATWEEAIERLTTAGFRVVAPDQIGFCKSTKPANYQFSFHQLAQNTHALLDNLEIDKATVMGHSMGGMLATRYALMYPDQVEQLVLVNPIGLEDWKAKGVPYQDISAAYEAELKTNAEAIREYQQATYYAGEWQPRYDKWVDMLAGMYAGEDGERVAWNQALTSDMVYTQPVVYELDHLSMPTLLLIGEQDNTAIGKARATPEARDNLGRYDTLGEQAAERIPESTLIEFPELGHSPHIQAPDTFYPALLDNLTASQP